MDQNNKVSKIKRHNYLVEARYKLETNEQRVMYYALAIANKSGKIERIDINRSDLGKICEIGGTDLSRVFDSVTTKLMQRFLFIRNLDSGAWKKLAWISKAEYKDGICSLLLNKELEPYLTDLSAAFLSTDFSELMQFRSTYAVRLYELCKQYSRIGHRSFDLDDFKACLGVDHVEAYNHMSDFKRKAVQPAINEIRKKTTMDIQVKYIKTGKKITQIEFTFSAIAILNDSSTKAVTKAVKENKKKVAALPELSLKNIEEALQMVTGNSKDFLRFGAAYALDNLRYTVQRSSTGVRKYFLLAYDNNYAGAEKRPPKQGCSRCGGKGIVTVMPDGSRDPADARVIECNCWKS